MPQRHTLTVTGVWNDAAEPIPLVVPEVPEPAMSESTPPGLVTRSRLFPVKSTIATPSPNPSHEAYRIALENVYRIVTAWVEIAMIFSALVYLSAIRSEFPSDETLTAEGPLYVDEAPTTLTTAEGK
jgi:hypothetical protein